MRKALPFIAVAVILLTIFACALRMSAQGDCDPGDLQMIIDLGRALSFLVFVLILTSEIGLFSGIALLLSKNRTTLKLIFGAVIAITSLAFLVFWIRLFFGLYIKPEV